MVVADIVAVLSEDDRVVAQSPLNRIPPLISATSTSDHEDETESRKP
jgi:hypothetical protein